LDQVNWVSGDATNKADVQKMASQNYAVVHAIGLLFHVESGLRGLNTIVSGFKSVPDPETSTYDIITRQTMFNIIEAIESPINRYLRKKGSKTPLAFVSGAEAG